MMVTQQMIPEELKRKFQNIIYILHRPHGIQGNE